MFANVLAIETLVRSDPGATDREKSLVIAALNGNNRSVATDVPVKVIGFDEAARMIGKPRKAIYHLLHNGTLKGFYSGKTKSRATGITLQSVEDAVSAGRGLYDGEDRVVSERNARERTRDSRRSYHRSVTSGSESVDELPRVFGV